MGIPINSFSLLIFCNFSIISPQQKVLNLTNRGSSSISKPFSICWRALFFLNYFSEKEGFLKVMSNTWYIMREILHLNNFYIYIILYKFNIVTCMKVTGETFLSIIKEKEPKRQDTKSIETFRQKNRYRTELWRALYKKSTEGATPNF